MKAALLHLARPIRIPAKSGTPFRSPLTSRVLPSESGSEMVVYTP